MTAEKLDNTQDNLPLDREAVVEKLRLFGIDVYRSDFTTMMDEDVIQVADWLLESAGYNVVEVDSDNNGEQQK